MNENNDNIENNNPTKNHILNDILERIKKITQDAFITPENVSIVGPSPRDLSALINAQKKKEILLALRDVSLGDKIDLLSDIDVSDSDNIFEKKEIPYISRFTMYSILEELLDKSGEILQHQKEINKLSYVEIVENLVSMMGLESKDVVLLKELINKNENHYLKHFGEEYNAKLKLVKKVLRNYK